MEISGGKLDKRSANFVESPNTIGVFSEDLPDTIVIYYTAESSAESSVRTLTNPNVKASAHMVYHWDYSTPQ